MRIINNPCLRLCVFFLCFSFNNHISFGADTISANHSLSGDQTIVSKGGYFELGFFKPGNSSNYYIGLWYKNVSPQTIAWVANRETPIADKYFSELKIIDGNLVLLNESQTPVWSTSKNSTTSNLVIAVLLDNGNLVLRDGFNSTQPIWQSFDNPVDTWLPGSKVAYNKLTNTHQRLSSWKNSEDPAPGLFSLNIDANNNQYLLLWNGSEQYWTSGPWNGHVFSFIPYLAESISNYNFSFVDNENETYFTYSVANPSIRSRLVMDVSGQIQTLIWLDDIKNWNIFWVQPPRQCEVYSFCGAFGTCNQIIQPFCNCLTGFRPKLVNEWNNLDDYSGGCVRRTELQCGNTTAANRDRDRFWVYSNMTLSEHPQSLAVGSVVECESACLSNCSCTAYAYDSNGCSIWIGDLLNVQQLSENDGRGRTLYLRLAASEFSSAKINKKIIIGAIMGSVAVIVFLGLVFVIWKWQSRLVGTSFWLWSNAFCRWSRFPLEKGGEAVEGSLVAFRYKDLQKATKNFSEKLGGGGFGSVFKGTLPHSTVIAVKKLESISQGEKQFRAEVSTIGIIQHVNLVQLRGFCSEGNYRFLVYDYILNGSLDSHLFNVKESKVLEWKTRYQIALGIARGLAYLHEKCRDCIIHLDIKPENVLLDADFCPKIADFGLAKVVGREFSRVLTTMRGTIGYLAPELISGVTITAKADVYSYGMMLFEFISGRRNTEQSGEWKVKFFPAWAAGVIIEGGDVLSLLDHMLERNVDAEELRRICIVACWCIQHDENHRPSMGQVVQILEGVLDVNPPSNIPRFLQALVDDEDISM